ncbi:MAG: NAD(P)/FAD-dependent oxidoreductase, partial [Clostridia bacterium]|nr:NAD(P)/FAD-dependent oxidoreductase [Clostridia bacterium]
MKIAVIGAGLTGLTAALKLLENGISVDIYDAADTAGGLAAGFTVGKDRLDRFYHHMFVSDSELLSLVDELELSDKVGWYEPKNAIFVDDRLYPFTTPLDLLLFKPLSFASRIRMGLLVLRSKFIKDYTALEKIQAKEWIVRHSGKDAYGKVWGPLLKSKFDKDSDTVSGTWIWNKFKLRGSSRGKNISKEQLGYMDKGFMTLIDGLTTKISALGGTLYLNAPVHKITKSGEALKIESPKGIKAYDKVLFTASPEILRDMALPLPSDYEKKLSAIKTKANLCLTLELKESLSPYYWITIAQEGLPFVLMIEHTNLVGLRDYQSHVVYLSRYIDASDPLFNALDKEIMEYFISGIKKVFPAFKRDWIKNTTLARARYAQPVVTLGYGNEI